MAEEVDRTQPGDPADQSTGELVKQLSEQVSHLVRDEIRFGVAELQQKGKRAGLGVGMFSGAGLVAFYGVAAVVAAVILALAQALAPWVAALLVGVVLMIVAAVLALLGKRQVGQAIPPVPEQTVENVRRDIETVKGKART